MGTTSLSYAFANVDVDSIVRDAFAQCGMNNSLISGWQYKMANDSLNFLLTSWLSKRGLNLFTVEQNMLEIIQGQRLYPLPANTSKILECVFANANQIILPGSTYTASSIGTPSVFTATPSSFKATTDLKNPNAYMACYFPANQPQPIQYVGIVVPSVSDYQLSVDCTFSSQSLVGNDPAWMTVYSLPRQTYYAGQTQWVALPFTHNACGWRIKNETPGDPLTLLQVLLDIPYNSLKMSRVGRDTYTFFPTNSQQGPSTTYYVNRAGQPTLDVWTTPDSQWQFFVYNRVRSIQDAGDYTNSLDMTPRFLEAAATGLAARLARLYAVDKAANLQTLADQLFLEVAKEDTENVDIQMSIDSQGYYGS